MTIICLYCLLGTNGGEYFSDLKYVRRHGKIAPYLPNTVHNRASKCNICGEKWYSTFLLEDINFTKELREKMIEGKIEYE